MQTDGRPRSAASTPASSAKRDRRGSASKSTRAQPASTRTRKIAHCDTQTETAPDALQCANDNGSPSPSRSLQTPPLLAGLLRDLKARLSDLELDLDRLRRENELLRQEQASASLKRSSVDAENQSQRSNAIASTDHDALERSLQSHARQMSLLEARFHRLEDRLRAKAALHEQSLGQIEALNAQLFRAQQQLVAQQHALDNQTDLAHENDALRQETHVLRSERAALQDAVATLSSRPFDALSADLQTKNLSIAQLEATIQTLERELQCARQDANVARQTHAQLRTRIQALEAASLEHAEALEQSKLACERHRMAQDIAELQLRFYASPDDKELLVALGRGLKDMRTRVDATSKLTSFMERVSEPSSASVSVSRAPAVQLCATCRASAAKTDPLQQQRLARAAELTALVQEDAQAQLASTRLQHAQQMQVLRRKLRKADDRAAAYLAQIRALQATTRSAWLSQAASRGEDSNSSHRHSGASNDAIADRRGTSSTSLVSASPASPVPSASPTPSDVDERDPLNVTAVALSELRFHDASLLLDPSPPASSAASLVVLCDYYDFESQVSPVLSVTCMDGPSAPLVVPLDVEITYKTCQDAAFFRSLAARTLHIEVQRLRVGSTALLAVADADLNALFLARDGRCATTLALREPHTHARVGSIRLEQSLAHPVDAFYKSVVPPSSRSALSSTPLTAAAHAHAALRQTGAERTATVTVRVLALLLMKTFVLDATTAARRARPRLDVAFRFMGYPSARVPLELPSAASAGGYFVVPPSQHAQSFEVDASASCREFLATYALEMQLRAAMASTEPTVVGAASVSMRTAMDQIVRTHAPSGFVFANIVDSSTEPPRLLGRLCVEIGMSCDLVDRGAPCRFLPVTPPHVLTTLAALFATELSLAHSEPQQADWRKFHDVMSLSRLERALRQLLCEKTSPSQRAQLRCAIAKVKTDASLFDSLEAFRALLRSDRGDGDRSATLSAVDIAMLFSGLRHASASSSGDKTAETLLHRRLALLIETCESPWIEIEASLRQRTRALGCLGADAVLESEQSEDDRRMVSWPSFLDRLGLPV